MDEFTPLFLKLGEMRTQRIKAFVNICNSTAPEMWDVFVADAKAFAKDMEAYYKEYERLKKSETAFKELQTHS